MSKSSADSNFITTRCGQKVLIDAKYAAKAASFRWKVRHYRQQYRIITSTRVNGLTKALALGNFLLEPGPGYIVILKDPTQMFDYRRSNLLICTMKDRQRHLPKRKADSSSRFKGVSRSKNGWRAGIQFDKKSLYLGEFVTEEEAASAYNKAATEIFGSVAYLNRFDLSVSKTEGTSSSRRKKIFEPR